ncbi:MAG: DUF4860 domain-containing protein [Oscillospiraceae bacterium]|nr:DUF4860 domain-containing protein [Oscillospiraceae bacterium]
MDGRKGAGKADIVGTVGSMLLFLVFTVCMLVIIAAAASTYAGISSGFDRSFTSSASLRYLSNKIRGAESYEIIEGGTGIAAVNGGITCVIYYKDGGLYEKNVSSSDSAAAGGGDKIFNIDGLEITEENGLYVISVSYEEESSSVFIGGR